MVDVAVAVVVAVVAAVVGVRVAVLVWEVFLARAGFLGTGVAVARVLLPHAGRSRVTVAFTEWPSSDSAGRRAVGVATVRRLAGRGACGVSATSRVPNFALADDSRPYDVVAPPLRAPLVASGLGLTRGFCRVTLSAPQ